MGEVLKKHANGQWSLEQTAPLEKAKKNIAQMLDELTPKHVKDHQAKAREADSKRSIDQKFKDWSEYNTSSPDGKYHVKQGASYEDPAEEYTGPDFNVNNRNYYSQHHLHDDTGNHLATAMYVHNPATQQYKLHNMESIGEDGQPWLNGGDITEKHPMYNKYKSAFDTNVKHLTDNGRHAWNLQHADIKEDGSGTVVSRNAAFPHPMAQHSYQPVGTHHPPPGTPTVATAPAMPKKPISN
jgi:hypothetical protein